MIQKAESDAPQGHHRRGKEVHDRGHALPAENHDSDEARLQHEGHGGLVAQHVSEEIAARAGKTRSSSSRTETPWGSPWPRRWRR